MALSNASLPLLLKKRQNQPQVRPVVATKITATAIAIAIVVVAANAMIVVIVQLPMQKVHPIILRELPRILKAKLAKKVATAMATATKVTAIIQSQSSQQ